MTREFQENTVAIILNELFKDSKELNTQIQFDALIEKYAERIVKLFFIPDVSESALNDDIELELRQRTQELPSKTTVGEKIYYEAGWRESAKHTKMLISHSR